MEKDGKCDLHKDCIHQAVCDYWMGLRRDELRIRMDMKGCMFYTPREK